MGERQRQRETKRREEKRREEKRLSRPSHQPTCEGGVALGDPAKERAYQRQRNARVKLNRIKVMGLFSLIINLFMSYGKNLNQSKKERKKERNKR